MKRKPKVFIGSSSEATPVLRLLEGELIDRKFTPVPWPNAFGLSRSTLSELCRLARDVDFAVFIWSADAMVEDRGARQWMTRDNVIYEAGLFAGVLSPTRVFVVLEAGSEIKMPSDLSGIGYAEYEPGDDGVRAAAVAIERAIARAERELDDADATRSIEGLWVDAILSREGSKSVISTFELRRPAAGVLEIVNGRSWDPDGEPRAKFSSSSSKFDASLRTLYYSWQGAHPRESGLPEFFGVGELQFDPSHPDRADGWFSNSPRLDPERTSIVSRICLKAQADAESLASDDVERRKQAVARLLRWRANL